MEGTLRDLEELARATGKPESELIALAFQSGIRQLWREHVLGSYLRGEMSHEEATARAGAEWVELAERQRDAMQEDLEWALDT